MFSTFRLKMETAQPLHPESKVLLDRIVQLKAKPYTQLSVDEARARSKLVNTQEANAGRIEYDGTRKELFVPLPDFTGIRLLLNLDVYKVTRPRPKPENRPRPKRPRPTRLGHIPGSNMDDVRGACAP